MTKPAPYQTSQVRKLSSSGLVAGSGLAVCPGDVFVVGGVVAEAAVEDPYESVAQCTQGLVVGVAGLAMLVVEGAGAEAGGEGAEGPLVDGVIQAAVADMAGQHGALLARRDGQW